jgi:hypothetical protein
MKLLSKQRLQKLPLQSHYYIRTADKKQAHKILGGAFCLFAAQLVLQDESAWEIRL